MKNEDLTRLKEAVFKRRSVLKNLYNQKNKESLFDYINSWDVAEPSLDKKFLKIFEEQLSNQFSQAQTQDIINQLKNKPLVSTIDHHGILTSPFFINSNLLFSFYKNLKYLIVLSTEGVSLNNSSWPASILFNKDGKLKRISIFANKEKNRPVLAKRAFTKKQAESFMNKIQNKNLQKLAKEIFLDQKILKQKYFSDQVNLINFKLWPKLFPKSSKVVYLPLESLVSEIIVKVITKDKKHILHHLLFSKKGWVLMEKYFGGLKGAFTPTPSNSPSEKGRMNPLSLLTKERGGEVKGSFLFWGVDGGGKRVRMERREGRIEGEGIGVNFTPIEISKALKNRKLYPTSLVCFLVLLYYGLTCLGGFNQITWLTDIKERFVKLLEELEEFEIASKISQIPTNNFAEGDLAFLYHQNKLIKPTGIDIYLAGDDVYKKYKSLAKTVTVGESIESLLPEIYKIVVSVEDRLLSLLSITDEDIAKMNKMAGKIKKSLG